MLALLRPRLLDLRAYPRMNPVVWETSGILSSLSWVNSILGQALRRLWVTDSTVSGVEWQITQAGSPSHGSRGYRGGEPGSQGAIRTVGGLSGRARGPVKKKGPDCYFACGQLNSWGNDKASGMFLTIFSSRLTEYQRLEARRVWGQTSRRASRRFPPRAHP